GSRRRGFWHVCPGLTSLVRLHVARGTRRGRDRAEPWTPPDAVHGQHAPAGKSSVSAHACPSIRWREMWPVLAGAIPGPFHARPGVFRGTGRSGDGYAARVSATGAATQDAGTSGLRPWAAASQRDGPSRAPPSDRPGEPASRSIVGMKYVNVAIRSTNAMAAAASHHGRAGPSSSHAATAFASISRVSGTVVT